MALRGLTFPQLALAAVLGVAGGLYVYKPIYQRYNLQEQRKTREAAEGSSAPEAHRADIPPRAEAGERAGIQAGSPVQD
ncbi:protein PIGBOS1-like [Scyliorhinus canicula]|uniref:protein PIGBOS1-like n=1 Tax=Scyliorhinus canicula TaxID=7830 RepID=UPI0018F393C9|nr:protein PIGBOS1-like [Scyliorhinus canicula]